MSARGRATMGRRKEGIAVGRGGFVRVNVVDTTEVVLYEDFPFFRRRYWEVSLIL